MASSKKKIYVVETAPDNFITFNSWPECQKKVQGQSYAYAGGFTKDEAIQRLQAGKKKFAAAKARGWDPSKKKAASKTQTPPEPYPTTGLTSDCGTHGNPGPCEYQVTDLSGKVLVHKHLGVHTNNYAELAGIGAMIKQALKMNDTVLWTDSTIAMIWIRKAKLGENVREKEAIMDMILSIRKMLEENPQLELKKWDTKNWGQIPSDFGRK